MTHDVVWALTAVDRATLYLRDDPAGLSVVMDAVDELAKEPHPTGSVEFGSPYVRRWHVGRYRVLYEIDDATRLITVVHLGRLG